MHVWLRRGSVCSGGKSSMDAKTSMI
jgi:hypothetical protein